MTALVLTLVLAGFVLIILAEWIRTILVQQSEHDEQTSRIRLLKELDKHERNHTSEP